MFLEKEYATPTVAFVLLLLMKWTLFGSLVTQVTYASNACFLQRPTIKSVTSDPHLRSGILSIAKFVKLFWLDSEHCWHFMRSMT